MSHYTSAQGRRLTPPLLQHRPYNATRASAQRGARLDQKSPSRRRLGRERALEKKISEEKTGRTGSQRPRPRRGGKKGRGGGRLHKRTEAGTSCSLMKRKEKGKGDTRPPAPQKTDRNPTLPNPKKGERSPARRLKDRGVLMRTKSLISNGARTLTQGLAPLLDRYREKPESYHRGRQL